MSGSALWLPLAAAPAWAQDAEGASDNNVIIVTAQRREEALEDVPMSVAVVTSDLLESSGVASLRDIAKLVPGFQLGNAGGFHQPAIRGVTSLINVQSSENNVAVYIDGFYEISPQAISIDLPNVESVQILKGPQGTLYGRNATGGAILLNTLAPRDHWEGKAELTYARFDDKRASGFVAGPLSDQVGVSISGYTRRSDGYIKLVSRTVPGKVTGGNAAPLEQDSVRLKLKVDPTDTLSAVFAYNYTHTFDGRAHMFSPFENVAQIYNTLPGGATRATKLGTAAWDHAAGVGTTQHQATATLMLDTGIGKLKSYTGYSKSDQKGGFDFDGSYINTGYNSNHFKQNTFQQAVDFNIDAVDRVDIILGAMYLDDRLKAAPPFTRIFSGTNQSAPGTVPPTFANLVQIREQIFRQSKEAWAVYADATFKASDSISINVGGRYSKEKQAVFGLSKDPRTGIPNFPETRNGSSYAKFTPRASIRYEIAPRTNVYASYSQGFRSGVWNAALPTTPANWQPADQETVDAFEVGFKTASGNLNFEIAGFYYDYKDIQVALTQTIGTPPVPTTLISNAPSAETYGVDVSLQWKVDNLTLRGGATMLHARYGDGFLYDGIGVNPANSGINANGNPLKTYLNINQVQDLSGLQMARAPNFAATFGADYLFPMGDGGLRISANASYTDSYVITNPSVWGALVGEKSRRQQRFRQGNYALLSASVTWTDPTDHYYVRVWGNNLTDHRYRLHYTGTSTYGTYSPMAEPRTYGVSIGYRFGKS